MNRLLTAIKTDVTVQIRTNLYTIGIGVGVVVAVALSQLAPPDQLFTVIPTLMLLVIGGSTLLYVAGMILFEKDEGTLNAVIVSPMRATEYLWSKILTLSGLATLESIIMIGGTMLIMSLSETMTWPNLFLLLTGIIFIGVIYTLIGIIMIVRFDKITDFLIPMSGVAVVLQLPFLYFLGWVEQDILLVIPTSAPTVLMQAAYGPLTTGEWVYGVGYTTTLVTILSIWAYRAFQTHIVAKGG